MVVVWRIFVVELWHIENLNHKLWKLNFDMTSFQLNFKTYSETGIVNGRCFRVFQIQDLGEMASVASGYDMLGVLSQYRDSNHKGFTICLMFWPSH